MALSKIDWSQIESANIPSGVLVNVGSTSTNVNDVYTKNLFLNNINILTLLTGSGILRPTGSIYSGYVYATTNDLEITGSLKIKGDLEVNGQTILSSTDINQDSLIVKGLMSIVQNEINTQIASASLTIENLGTLGDRGNNDVVDLGFF